MIKFGTSGFRAVMGDGYTKEAVQRISYGLIQYAKTNKVSKPTVAVGFDNRFMSEMYAKWCIEVLATHFQIKFFVKPVPTPLISYECGECDFGLMITSSHNPFYYNGIKLFKKGSFEMIDDETKVIAEFANNVELSKIPHIDYVEALENGRIEKVADFNAYVNAIKSNIDEEVVRGEKVKVLINAMYGSGAEVLKQLVSELELKKAEVMNAEIDPYFAHSLPAPTAKTLTDQIERLKDEKFDFGLAVDGDADRFALIEKDGTVYDCNFVSAVLYSYLKRKKGLSGAFVKPFAFSGLGVKVAENLGEQGFEVWSGFKNIGNKFQEEECILGADSTGIAVNNHIASKDGILICVLMIEMLISENKTFSEILEELQTEVGFVSYSLEKSYEITENQKKELNSRFIALDVPKFKGYKLIKAEKIEDLKFEFENGYWTLIRISGTELALRTYAEMPTKEDAEAVISVLEEFYGLK